MMGKSLILALGLFYSLTNCVLGYPLEETYGYITVRPGAHMFYVLYENDAPAGGNWTDYPLISWLQGGPGSSGVGYGNFWELGPYYIDGTLRQGRWTQKGNLLFVDNPVGTGYSYVEDISLLTTTNEQIAADLVEFTRQLYLQIPDLELMPYFIYSESYGGKMTVDYALGLQQAIENGTINCDLQGVGLGDGWISPMDSVNTWGSFLYSFGYVSEQERAIIDAQAAITQAAVDAEDWVNATNEWGQTERVLEFQTGGVSFYNIFLTTQVYSRVADHKKNLNYMSPDVKFLYEQHVLPFETADELEDYMNGAQAEAWDIPDNVTWGGQSGETFDAQAGDFMKPVIDSVVALLETTDLHVAVYNGDWDLIVDTPGTYNWVEAMDWADKPAFMDAERERMFVSSFSPQAGYYQRSGQFSLFTFLRAGHMVPMDSPEMCLDMIDMVFGFAAETSSKEKAEKIKSTKVEEPKTMIDKRKMEKELKSTKVEGVNGMVEEKKKEEQKKELEKEVAELAAQIEAYRKNQEVEKQLKKAELKNKLEDHKKEPQPIPNEEVEKQLKKAELRKELEDHKKQSQPIPHEEVEKQLKKAELRKELEDHKKQSQPIPHEEVEKQLKKAVLEKQLEDHKKQHMPIPQQEIEKQLKKAEFQKELEDHKKQSQPIPHEEVEKQLKKAELRKELEDHKKQPWLGHNEEVEKQLMEAKIRKELEDRKKQPQPIPHEEVEKQLKKAELKKELEDHKKQTQPIPHEEVEKQLKKAELRKELDDHKKQPQPIPHEEVEKQLKKAELRKELEDHKKQPQPGPHEEVLKQLKKAELRRELEEHKNPAHHPVHHHAHTRKRHHK